MLIKRNLAKRDQLEFNSLAQLAQKNHSFRKIDAAIDFNFIYDKVAELYSEYGKPSVYPIVLIKIIMIQYLFGIPSIR